MPPICLIQTAKENIGLCGRLSAFWRRLEWLPLLFYLCSRNLLHHFDKNIVRNVGSSLAGLFSVFARASFFWLYLRRKDNRLHLFSSGRWSEPPEFSQWL